MGCFCDMFNIFIVKIREFDSYLPWSNTIESEMIESFEIINSDSDNDSPKKNNKIMNLPNFFII